MKLQFLVIVAVTVILTNHADGLYPPRRGSCPNPRVPTKAPRHTDKEKRYMNTIAQYLRDTWVRPQGGKSPARGGGGNNRGGNRRRQRPQQPSYFPPYYQPPGSKPTGPPPRKEYRQMTKTEMDRFHRCINSLKQAGRYDQFTRWHSFDFAPAAHLGAAFLPWHRHFIFRMVQTLRELPNCRDVFLPYWDCTLDQPLPSPHHAVQWQDKFWGNNQGDVTSGRLGNRWSIIDTCTDTGSRLRRQVNTTGMDFCSKQNILNLLAPKTYAEFMAFAEGRRISDFELAHGEIHCYVGTCLGSGRCRGHLGCVDCSPSDPVFFLLHSFVDCLWYEWANLHGRKNVYPKRNVPGGRNHSANSPMNPFEGLVNRDGFSDPEYSRCKPRPGRQGFTCGNDRDCKSPLHMLWCNNRCQCVSKVREGGDCKGLPDGACYCGNRRGRCVSNRCSC